MRDFVRDSWKIAVAFAAGAFLLSCLIGLITRNPFGVVLLRAFLIALLFAGVGTGFRAVVHTWLPELAGQPANAGDASAAGTPGPVADADESRGSKVDIVLDDEAMPARERYESEETAADADEAGLTELGGEEPTPAEAAALGELSGELADDASPPGDEDVLPPGLAELPAASSAPRGGSSRRVDSLPDIALQGEASSSGPGKGAARARRPRASTPGNALRDAVRDNVARQDPATLARALRTVLKKDEKG